MGIKHNGIVFAKTLTGEKLHILRPNAPWYKDGSYCGICTEGAIGYHVGGVDSPLVCKSCKKAYNAAHKGSVLT